MTNGKPQRSQWCHHAVHREASLTLVDLEVKVTAVTRERRPPNWQPWTVWNQITDIWEEKKKTKKWREAMEWYEEWLKKSPVQAGSGKKRQGKQRWGRKDKENLTVINLSVDFAPKNVCFFSSAQASPPPDKQITRHNPNSNLPGRRAIKEEPLGRDEAGERPELTLRLMESWRWHEETDREEKWRRGSVKNGTTTV